MGLCRYLSLQIGVPEQNKVISGRVSTWGHESYRGLQPDSQRERRRERERERERGRWGLTVFSGSVEEV